MTDRPVILAAGGTGGHMFPAEALARTLLARRQAVALVTDRRGQAFGKALPEVPVHRIHAAQLGGGVIGRARTAIELFRGYREALALLKRLGPAVVVGFGGYASAPTARAASRLGLPVLLHEQNAVLGRANRWLAPRADVIATAFPDLGGLRPEDRGKVVATGNPVRPAFAAVASIPYRPPQAYGPVHLLVLGGSQGARVFSEIVPAALARLPAELRGRIEIVQQCRPEDLAEARKAFQRAGIKSVLDEFFRDVPQRLARAHLAVCRAGASTLAELAAAGRPAILVPYPFATDDHQTANARALAEAGGAWLMPQPEFTPEHLADRLEALLAEPQALAAAARAAAGFGRADAAERLADAVLRLGGLGGGRNGNGQKRQEAAE